MAVGSPSNERYTSAAENISFSVGRRGISVRSVLHDETTTDGRPERAEREREGEREKEREREREREREKEERRDEGSGGGEGGKHEVRVGQSVAVGGIDGARQISVVLASVCTSREKYLGEMTRGARSNLWRTGDHSGGIRKALWEWCWWRRE